MTYTTAKAIVDFQRENLRKAHNVRFARGDYEYKIAYEGGLAEFIGIYRRKLGKRNFEYITGFAGYKFHSAEQVVSYAKAMVEQIEAKDKTVKISC